MACLHGRAVGKEQLKGNTALMAVRHSIRSRTRTLFRKAFLSAFDGNACSRRVILAGVLSGVLAPQAVSADAFPGDLLLFPELTSLHRFDLQDGSSLKNYWINPGLNLFYGLDQGRFRFLLEWLVDRSAQEVQRLQLGWRWQDTTFWVGRFHNPIGYWNIHFHHGAYMMTSITRPGVMTYETSGGPLPMHVTGLYVEGVRELGDSSLYYVLNAGVGPDLEKKRLDAFDVLDPEGTRLPAVTLRLGYQPVSFGSDEIGFSFSYTEISGRQIGVDRINQIVAGVFANWRSENLGFLGEAFYIHNDFTGGASEPESDVLNLYGQAEWRVADDLTLYSRIEGTFNDNGDLYFDHFRNFVRDRYMGGVRYELPYKMALKLELSREHTRDDAFGQVGLQWSAVFP